ncbi:MAG: riboflavin biosynthesis protein RibF [Firmicutes bacterium]|nr:riboflavin biosynthesis protein RibF [Bacillota bacterium]
MRLYEFYGDSKGSAICLGDFDGVHKGHRRVFAEASKTGDWGALLFTHNSKGEKEILTLSEKLELLKKLGAKYALAADFEKELKSKSPGEFVEVIASFKVRTVAVGYDYRFGKGAEGDVSLLKELCSKRGIDVIVAEVFEDNKEPVKSTKIRALIKNGDISEANRLLDSPYIISGKVVKGLGNGKVLGFPTANIEVSEYKLLPCDGVYKGKVGDKSAVVNVGKNPTFEAKRRTVEVHIVGEEKDLYGKDITVQIIDRIRDEIKFEKKEELILQIKRDIESIKGEK